MSDKFNKYENSDKKVAKMASSDDKTGKVVISLVLTSLIALFIIFAVWPFITVTIYAGERGVLYKRFFNSGVDLKNVYQEGLHFVLPWNIMTPYSIRIQEVSDSIVVLTSEGMEVELGVSTRFRPTVEGIPNLHEDVGPDYLNILVKPEVKGVILSTFANKSVEEIYTTIYTLIDIANEVVYKDLKEKNVQVEELVIKSISFPDDVKNAINEKIKHRQNALAYEYRIQAAKREAKRKEEEAKGIRAFQSIISKGISENYLKWKGIDATLELSKSNNSKVVIIGSAKNGLPLILNTDSSQQQVELPANPSLDVNITDKNLIKLNKE